MAKYFEIKYDPAQWNVPPGGVATGWSSPYGGLNVQSPENLIGPQYTPAVNNFFFRNSELRSRPRFTQLLPGPDGQNPILGVASFLSRQQIWHTVAFTSNGMFQLLPSALKLSQPWVRLGGPTLDPSQPVRARAFQSILYYTNGSGHLSAWDGAAASPITDVAFTGATNPPPSDATTLSGLFMGELDNHIILGYTVEVTSGAVTSYPQRIRWSNNGFNPYDAGGNFGGNLGTTGATFDPTITVNAGLDDFLDVPDILTGMLFLGRNGYLFRQNGITSLAPTGQGSSPFQANHMWASERGIGNVFPSTIAQYGGIGMFVSADNVYQIQPSTVQAIGGGARDSIMFDLANAIDTPRATISPSYALNYIYLAYHLFIPLSTGTRVYVFSMEDGNWTSWFVSGSDLGTPAACYTGDIPIITGSQAASGATGGNVPAPPAPPSPSGGGGGGNGGGIGCPLSGAPVVLWGDPSLWTKTEVPNSEFFQVITESGRTGYFSTTHRGYLNRGLRYITDWTTEDFALTDDGEERIVSITPITIPGGAIDKYESPTGHVYSAWGFVCHNNKPFGEGDGNVF